MSHEPTALGQQSLPLAERWRTGERTSLYTSRWVSLDLVDVTPPHGEPYRHHVVSIPPAVAVVVLHPDKGVLLLYRHRFITDTAGFEVPAGGVDPGESIEAAAVREVLEETGWEVGQVQHFYSGNASDGASDQRFHYVLAHARRYAGDPQDAYESSSRQWCPADRIPELIRTGQVPGCLSSVALLYALQFGLLERTAARG